MSELKKPEQTADDLTLLSWLWSHYLVGKELPLAPDDVKIMLFLRDIAREYAEADADRNPANLELAAAKAAMLCGVPALPKPEWMRDRLYVLRRLCELSEKPVDKPVDNHPDTWEPVDTPETEDLPAWLRGDVRPGTPVLDRLETPDDRTPCKPYDCGNCPVSASCEFPRGTGTAKCMNWARSHSVNGDPAAAANPE